MKKCKFCRYEENVPSLGLYRGARIDVMRLVFSLVLLLGVIEFSISILLKAGDAQASVGSDTPLLNLTKTPTNQSNSALSNTSAVVLVGQRLINILQLVQDRLANIVNELEGIRNATLRDEKPIVITDNNEAQFAAITLGGAFGGAIAGGFLSSYLSSKFSNASRRNSDHIKDLKVHIVEPLLEAALAKNFRMLEEKFSNFRIGSNANPQADDVLFQDFAENHYPRINVQLGLIINIQLDDAVENEMVETLRPRIEQVIQGINFEGPKSGAY